LLGVARLALAGMAATAMVVLGGVGSAQAQQTEPVSIKVAPVLRGEAPSSLPIKIQLSPEQGAKNAFIRIRGLPRTVALSEGHAIAPGAWSVPLAALATLTFILPAGLEGQSEVSISFVNIDGGVLAEARTTLVVAAAKVRPPAETRALAPPAAAPAPIVPKMDPAERERAMRLHAQGVEQLQRGNVYAARKFFELAATAGLAQSAIAAAATYDPDELVKLNVVGLQPDAAAARKWYEKARELGAVEAAERLRRLGSR
jgi:hypothetical protein